MRPRRCGKIAVRQALPEKNPVVGAAAGRQAVLERHGGQILSGNGSGVLSGVRLARGNWRVRGKHVRPGATKTTALITVEGERDDICGRGRIHAAHGLCRNKQICEQIAFHHSLLSIRLRHQKQRCDRVNCRRGCCAHKSQFC
ncbi:hypothetical protein [Paraburkholderia sprentiae]|uniref:hypothetical protein n=1 Tax=Paraburkholderia sprentiae TaxID=948107 RepID=UPI001E53CE20|nr:hypothetical protein [Paraburkholderia sprentiae]